MDVLRSFLRMWLWALLAGLFLVGVAIIAPQQLPVVLYKLGLVTTAGYGGYWLDRGLFPYARPHDAVQRLHRANNDLWPAALSAGLWMLRRAILVSACMLAVGMGL